MDIDTKKRLLSSFAAAEEFIQGKAGKMGDVMKKKTGIFYMTVCVFGISLAVCGIQADGRQNTSESQEEIQEETQKMWNLSQSLISLSHILFAPE